MNFPDLKDKEYETLFIIGNGFDLYHGLDSSYHDFYCWLNQNGHKDFIENMEKIFPDVTKDQRKLLWCDFEKALGQYNAQKIHDTFGSHIDDSFYDENKQTEAINRIAPVLNNIKPLMKEWAKSLSTKKITPKLQLSKNSRYINFNYTTVLEDLYDIPKENILHIHGSVTDEEDIVVGYNDGNDSAEINTDNINLERSLENIEKEMHKFYKDTGDIIDKYNDVFFDQLYDISRVVVLGHSLSSIDILYISRVVECVEDDTHWHFSAYSPKSVSRINAVIDLYKNRTTPKGNLDKRMKKENCWIFNM